MDMVKVVMALGAMAILYSAAINQVIGALAR